MNKFVNNVNKYNSCRKKIAANEVSGKSCSLQEVLILWGSENTVLLYTILSAFSLSVKKLNENRKEFLYFL